MVLSIRSKTELARKQLSPCAAKTDCTDTLELRRTNAVPLSVFDTARAESFRQIIGTWHFFGYGS